jgi:type III pantothenate kinase
MNSASRRPLVAVDIGNTTIRFGRLAGRCEAPLPEPEGVRRLSACEADFSPLAGWLSPEPHAWFVASVNRPAQQALAGWVRGNRPRDSYRLLARADLPLAVEVAFPDRVGMDRLAAAVGVNALRDPARPALAIDAGTAITVDAVSAAGAFLGGSILPGMKLSAAMLARHTDLLPHVLMEHDEPPEAIGRDTEGAIRSGLYWGTLGAIRELVARLSGELPAGPQIFASGGDARRLHRFLGDDVRHVPHLVRGGNFLAARHVGSANE